MHVDKYDGQTDYSADVAAVFDRFRHDAGRDYHVRLKDYADMNHVEEMILERVAKLFPDSFGRLDRFCARHRDFMNPTVAASTARSASTCPIWPSPTGSGPGSDVQLPRGDYHLRRRVRRGRLRPRAGGQATRDQAAVVCNDFGLAGRERILVVTGRTRAARRPSPEPSANSPISRRSAARCRPPGPNYAPDRIFTHFERQESLATLHGKLEDELVRIHDVLSHATAEQRDRDERELLLHHPRVTPCDRHRSRSSGSSSCAASPSTSRFLDELAADHACVSMVGDVAPDDPAQRTFRFTRRPADGMAYAAALADNTASRRECSQRRISPMKVRLLHPDSDIDLER